MRIRAISVGTMAVLLAACSPWHLARYDENTQKTLTALKGEMKVFLSDCAERGAKGEDAGKSLQAFRVKMAQAYEYERAKPNNTEGAEQVAAVSSMVDEVNASYRRNTVSGNACTPLPDGQPAMANNGCLSPGYCTAKAKVLDKAFDLAIATNNVRNK